MQSCAEQRSWKAGGPRGRAEAAAASRRAPCRARSGPGRSPAELPAPPRPLCARGFSLLSPRSVRSQNLNPRLSHRLPCHTRVGPPARPSPKQQELLFLRIPPSRTRASPPAPKALGLRCKKLGAELGDSSAPAPRPGLPPCAPTTLTTAALSPRATPLHCFGLTHHQQHRPRGRKAITGDDARGHQHLDRIRSSNHVQKWLLKRSNFIVKTSSLPGPPLHPYPSVHFKTRLY